MTKTGCPGFGTPCDRVLAASPMAVVQQIEISAAYDSSRRAPIELYDHAGRAFSRTIREEHETRQRGFQQSRHRSHRTGESQSTKCKFELLTLQLREGIGRSNGVLPGQKAPHALRRMCEVRPFPFPTSLPIISRGRYPGAA